MSSRNIDNLVRALSKPYVGAHFVYKEKEYKIWKVKEILSEEYQNIEPGKVIKKTETGNLVIKTGDNLIEVIEADEIDVSVGEYL